VSDHTEPGTTTEGRPDRRQPHVRWRLLVIAAVVAACSIALPWWSFVQPAGTVDLRSGGVTLTYDTAGTLVAQSGPASPEVIEAGGRLVRARDLQPELISAAPGRLGSIRVAAPILGVALYLALRRRRWALARVLLAAGVTLPWLLSQGGHSASHSGGLVWFAAMVLAAIASGVAAPATWPRRQQPGLAPA
jgi:hypothetical protein